ncbi:nucleotidyl transferase AbiEii/AbiGii toxin family protein [Parvibaculum sp.]|uniref:nucleotidyl transferase AbiEii/AbiGii toxin family protein n=1 Tax=Parvibaculum sp. TaxID=2024848 RepID=UPI001D8B4703|nr:nucleotidyl transferase AbiEii/AbiGii toxin family protein [Parvibaculum sp.]MBX3490393.1 nucleotidyl transferase AbiEii/AbiGii toxin family protein [Parvibaculum sp.]MCW5728250.1 nucleotidyl transferase AbiEii/AbiGii toxin family protein [Parvibaculum sp.]
MPDTATKIDLASWVEGARADPIAYRQRQATEVTLNAIAMSAHLQEELYLKGGILMGLAYASPRQTTDIDLTASFLAEPDVDNQICDLLNDIFPRVTTTLGYPDLLMKVHSIKRQPRGKFETADFPALKLKIAYAIRGSKQETALNEGKSVDVVEVDISFNEPTKNIQILELTGGAEIRAYSLADLIGEKYRAMLQQPIRRRNRRQDVYDLDLLISGRNINEQLRTQILEVLFLKCWSRNINPTIHSLSDPEVQRRAGAEWDSLKLEIGDIPDFAEAFDRVAAFYRSLPWNS